MPGRFILRPAVEPYLTLERRIARLSHERSVLVISARLPGRNLRERLAQQQANLEYVFILDVASDFFSVGKLDPEHEASRFQTRLNSS